MDRDDRNDTYETAKAHKTSPKNSSSTSYQTQSRQAFPSYSSNETHSLAVIAQSHSNYSQETFNRTVADPRWLPPNQYTERSSNPVSPPVYEQGLSNLYHPLSPEAEARYGLDRGAANAVVDSHPFTLDSRLPSSSMDVRHDASIPGGSTYSFNASLPPVSPWSGRPPTYSSQVMPSSHLGYLPGSATTAREQVAGEARLTASNHSRYPMPSGITAPGLAEEDRQRLLTNETLALTLNIPHDTLTERTDTAYEHDSRRRNLPVIEASEEYSFKRSTNGAVTEDEISECSPAILRKVREIPKDDEGKHKPSAAKRLQRPTRNPSWAQAPRDLAQCQNRWCGESISKSGLPKKRPHSFEQSWYCRNCYLRGWTARQRGDYSDLWMMTKRKGNKGEDPAIVP